MTSYEIPASDIKVSSYLRDHCVPSDGRLHGNYQNYQAWVANGQVSVDLQFLQVDFGRNRYVTAIATQERFQNNQYVTSYAVSYSTTCTTWSTIKEESGADKIFPGNAASDESVVTNMLPEIYFISADIIKIKSRIKSQLDFSKVLVIRGQPGLPEYSSYWRSTGFTKGLDLLEVSWAYLRVRVIRETLDQCSNYVNLNDDSRLSSRVTSSVYNDNANLNESNWYLFTGKTGYYRLPNKVVSRGRCGATAHCWMNGTHPTVQEGVVKRSVCFHGNSGVCQFSVPVYVRNCFSFFVYKLKKLVESWDARYCADGN
ncbi:predicted protein [Nematostella vectensis]|uniref:F5/8 type C domain-containing protein n=1 Tax=Nematostella vectensis TaxID=45351 RepID=A7SE91_NEMVE|nr:predicted protein [Nematostella vectensis]|eukprot:XP_001630056.1 predicted protein [Nematostella vectensis]